MSNHFFRLAQSFKPHAIYCDNLLLNFKQFIKEVKYKILIEENTAYSNYFQSTEIEFSVEDFFKHEYL